MTIFKANFSTGNSILFSGSRDSHDIYKLVATHRSLGTAGVYDCNYREGRTNSVVDSHAAAPFDDAGLIRIRRNVLTSRHIHRDMDPDKHADKQTMSERYIMLCETEEPRAL